MAPFVMALMGGFSPSDITGLRVWLDASDASTITHSGGAVSEWTSKDTNARTFGQDTPADQPTTGASTVNGRNVIDFNADYLVSDDLASIWTFLHDGTQNETFAVVKFGTVADPDALYALMGTQDITSGQRGLVLFYDDRSSVSFVDRFRVYSATGSGTASIDMNSSSTSARVAANTVSVIEAIVDPDNATAADRAVIRVNGGTSVGTNSLTNSPSASDPTATLSIGATATAWALTGQIAELIVYEATLTASERTQVREYLADKWGVTLA